MGTKTTWLGHNPKKGKAMKKLTKIMALVLAMVMALAMSVPAMAAGHTISVAENDTHEYKVFQVLTGTLSEEGSTQLGNPAWGADATADAQAEQSAQEFIDSLAGLTDQDVAQAVAAVVDTTSDTLIWDSDTKRHYVEVTYNGKVGYVVSSELGFPR